MQIFITGATGFIGQALTGRLLGQGHLLRVWARAPAKAQAALGAGVTVIDAGGGAAALERAIDGCDAVINLAGEPVIGTRWSDARKRALVDSRVGLTEAVVAAIAAAKVRPSVMVSASAVGFYGDRGEEAVDESAAPGSGFLAELCVAWEAAARAAEGLGVRVVRLRIGVVLGRGGGALASLLPVARLGVAGPIASGRQYMPWIHVDDLVGMITAALADPRYEGAVNGTAPTPASNRELMTTLGEVLRRPTIVPTPAFALRLALGEAATVLLEGQRAIPGRALALGFEFSHPGLKGAIEACV